MTSRNRYKEYESKSSRSWYDSTYYGSASRPSQSMGSAVVVQTSVFVPDPVYVVMPRAPVVQQLVFNPMTGRYELMNVMVQLQ